MPGYVNIGAYVGENSMIDTWATVGSCAQVGKDCHLSGGGGLGGVLEPPGAQPVSGEDGCFIGPRAIVIEGMLVGREAVIGAGVALTVAARAGHLPLAPSLLLVLAYPLTLLLLGFYPPAELAGLSRIAPGW